MAKKRRKNRRNGSIRLIVIFIVLLMLCIGCVIGLKLTEKIATEIDLRTYPLEYTDIIFRYSREYDVPESVILSMIKVESNFKEDAVSPAGACGLMQLMPETFIWLASTLGEEVSEEQIFDPELNIKYGTYYVSTLYSRFGSWENVYAAYNAGHGNVAKWLSDPRYSENGVLTDIPFPETENHVKKLVNVRAKYNELYFLGE